MHHHFQVSAASLANRDFAKSNKSFKDDRFSDFITTSVEKRRFIAQLPCEEKLACKSPIILVSPHGAGARTLAFAAWKKLSQPNRTLFHVAPRNLKRRTDMSRIVYLCHQGDLVVDDCEKLSLEELFYLSSLALSQKVRIICVFRSACAEAPLLVHRMALSRIEPMQIELEPLSSRRSDIPLLIRRVLSQFSPCYCSSASLEKLSAFDWPGNAEQLVYVLERAAERAKLRKSDFIETSDFRDLLNHGFDVRFTHSILSSLDLPQLAESWLYLGVDEALKQIEAYLYVTSLGKYGGNKSNACIDLKLPRATLDSRLRNLAPQIASVCAWLPTSLV